MRRTWLLAALALAACSKQDEPASGGGAGDMRAARRLQAEVDLRNLGKAARAHFVEVGGFPEGRAPLTPATPCCESGRDDRTCAPDPAAWTGVWEALDFALTEPHGFRYTYEGTKTTLTATAVADFDCDGTSISTRLVRIPLLPPTLGGKSRAPEVGTRSTS